VYPQSNREPYEEEREELFPQLLARNVFRAVMVYAVGFVLACVYIFVQ
jgi:hypothetical protein